MTYRTFLLILFSIIYSLGATCQIESDRSLNELKNNISFIVNNAIKDQAFPGCVVFASVNDSVLINKPYGFHTYDSLQAVSSGDLYDLASLTKIVGATIALMKLYEDGFYDLDDHIGKYIDGLGKIGRRVTFRQALAHQAGLEGWVRYFDKFSKSKPGKYKVGTIVEEDGVYSINDDLFLDNRIYGKIKREIKKSKLAHKPVYKYSGLFFYLVPEIVYNLSGQPFEQYLSRHFYEPLGAKSLMFNPLGKYPLSSIVPTEIDTFFRMSPIHGKVHDEGAILMKGVSGNAGLFSNADDLHKILKMLNDGGYVDSVQYLEPSTIQLFTTYQFPNNQNRRGLGFDKPMLIYDQKISSVSKKASIRSYGHTGYTGTLAWVDPEYNFIFIFLTNRVYPNRTYKKIYELNVRPEIHQLLYDFILDKQ